MMRKFLSLSLLSVLTVSLAFAGGERKRPVPEAIPNERQPVDMNVPFNRAPEPDWSRLTPTVGTFTTLTGFYDYQSNGGAVQHIRVNPANGNIHVVYMLATDSTAGLNASRRVGYAFSSNGGVSWNNFNNITVPLSRSGFPTIDLLKGANAGLPVIASHPDGTPTIAKLFVDSPEGAGAFSELNSPPILGQALEPIWPFVGSASDGSMIVAASQNDQNLTTGVGHHNRMQNDFTTWDPAWTTFPGDVQSGGRYPVHANNTGKVGILWNTSNGTAVLGNRWRESTNNGVTWSAPTNVLSQRIVGADTFFSYVHADFVYDGENPLMIFSEFKVDQGFVGDADIIFWSQATGFVVAVPFDSTKYTVDPLNQRFHRDSHGWPSIGLSGNTIVVAYQAFQPDTDRHGWHYGDLWYVASSNGGASWGAPQRITNTPTTDEKYPSVSKWNAPGEFNMVWSQKTGGSGLYAFPGSGQPPAPDTIRTYQMFLRVNPIQFTTSVDEGGAGLANSFKLSQNYPNPFNPTTNIDYTVGQSGPVSIKVYNMLGQEVATVVNQNVSPGTYQAAFDGSRLSSGVYIYKMTTGAYQQSKKMVLMK